jgi:hypothetical protein
LDQWYRLFVCFYVCCVAEPVLFCWPFLGLQEAQNAAATRALYEVLASEKPFYHQLLGGPWQDLWKAWVLCFVFDTNGAMTHALSSGLCCSALCHHDEALMHASLSMPRMPACMMSATCRWHSEAEQAGTSAQENLQQKKVTLIDEVIASKLATAGQQAVQQERQRKQTGHVREHKVCITNSPQPSADPMLKCSPHAVVQGAQAIDWEQAELGMAAGGASEDDEDEQAEEEQKEPDTSVSHQSSSQSQQDLRVI